MHRNDKFWVALSIVLFVLSMFTYPMWNGFIFGWPANYVVTVVISIIYCVFFAIMIHERLSRKEG